LNTECEVCKEAGVMSDNKYRDYSEALDKYRSKKHNRPLRLFPKLKRFVHKEDGTILAQFRYKKYQKFQFKSASIVSQEMAILYGEYIDGLPIEIDLSLSALRLRIRSFQDQGWPIIEETKALRHFNEMGLK